MSITNVYIPSIMSDRNVKLDVASKAVQFSYFRNVVLQLCTDVPEMHW